MKKPLILLGLGIALMPPAAYAILGGTAHQCTAQYAPPKREAAFDVGVGTRRHYLWSGFNIEAAFRGVDSPETECSGLHYEKEFWITGAGDAKMSRAEIETLLGLNVGDSSWENVRDVWRRRDDRAFAIEFIFERDGVPANALAVFSREHSPELADRVTAAFNRR